MKAPARTARYRVRVTRLGEARGLTHLAQIERMRRAVVSSGLPAVLSKRRRLPRPKLAFGPAISLGYESTAEYFDMELTAALPADEVAVKLGKSFEPGLAVHSVKKIPLYYPSLDASINVVRYEVRGPFPDDAGAALERFLKRSEIVIEKVKEGGARIERIDARPLILRMRMEAPDLLELSLRFGPKKTLKPEALLREWLGLGPGGDVLAEFRVLRKELLSETSRGDILQP